MNTVHLHKNRLDSNLKLFLLFIPAVIFTLILFWFLKNYKNSNNLAEIQTELNILGESTDNLTGEE